MKNKSNLLTLNKTGKQKQSIKTIQFSNKANTNGDAMAKIFYNSNINTENAESLK